MVNGGTRFIASTNERPRPARSATPSVAGGRSVALRGAQIIHATSTHSFRHDMAIYPDGPLILSGPDFGEHIPIFLRIFLLPGVAYPKTTSARLAAHPAMATPGKPMLSNTEPIFSARGIRILPERKTNEYDPA